MGYYVFHSSHIPTICPKCLEMWDKWCIFAVEFEIMTMMKRRLKEPINIRIIHESVYAGIFVFLLLWLTMPFNVETIHEGRPLFFLAQSVITTAVSMIIGLFTAHILRMPMDPKLPLNTVHRNSIVNYLINIPILALALTLFGGFFFYNNPIEPWWHGGQFHFDYFFDYIYYISATCIFLYIGTYVRNRNWHLRHQLEEVRTINALLEERQKAIAEQTEKEDETSDNTPCEEVRQCHLVGATGNSTLILPPSNIIYVESMSNYANICYMESDEVRQKMMRITLKQIMESIGGEPFMVQCHRAFIVNLNFVVSMSNRNSAYQLQIFGTDKPIPVSRNNTSVVKEKLLLNTETQRHKE